MTFLAATSDPTDHVKDLILFQTEDGTVLLTMHMITMVLVAVIFVWFMWIAAKQISTGPDADGNARYLTKGIIGRFVETLVVYLRDEMLEPVLGEKHTRRYLPYLMTLFFFILFQNLFGLIPILDLWHTFISHDIPTWVGGTATANLAVTGTLALISFVMIEIHGFRELGFKGWMEHNFGGLVPGPIYLFPIALLVFIVELAGHLIKPAALAIRLFANMVAGHTLLAVLVGFGYAAAQGGSGLLGTFAVSTIAGVAGVLVMFLELFVAFLQAFIFMFLTAVFISLLSHHDEHEEHESHETHEPAPQPA